MISVTFEMQKDKNFLSKFSERGRRRIFKEAYKEGLKFWKRTILPKHFQRGNIALYPSSFTKKKKSNHPNNGIPLVDTGRFKKNILDQENITGTFKGSRIGFSLGRPSNNPNEKLSEFNREFRRDIRDMQSSTKIRIFAFMKGKHITFNAARDKLIARHFKKTGYSAKTKVKMKKGVSAFNSKDRQEIRDIIHKFIINNMDRLGKANK